MATNYRKKYRTLWTRLVEFLSTLPFPQTVGMWHYPKAKLDEGWSLRDLYHHAQAAEQLGYDVILVAADHALVVKYRKHVPVDFAID